MTSTRIRRSAKPAVSTPVAEWRTIYMVTAYDSDGNVIATTDGETTFENADFARAFMFGEFRAARVVISDALGYTY